MSKTKIQSKVETVVYIGPTILGVVAKNTFFNNGLSTELTTAIKEIPVIGKLVVPISDYPKAMAQINKKEGVTYSFYQKALEHSQKKGDR